MPDLAKLVISCDSTQVVDGDKKMGQLASTTERAEAGLTKMNRVLAGLAVTAGIGLLARQAYNTNVEFERLNTSLVTVTKSQDRANQVFDELTSFAARTPFQLSEVTSAYIMMRARGLDPTMDTMTSLGNLASGMGRSFQDTIGAVGSLAAGEIEPMKQLGFSVMTIGDQVRISSGGVSESVQRNAYDISKAVARISDVKFAGGMERQINTLGGAFSNLQDQVDNTLYKMGQRGLNANLVQGMQDVTRVINEATPAMADFTAGAVNGSVEAVKWLADHKSAVLALGAAYVAVKVGQGVGGIQQGFSTGEGGGIGAKVKGVTDFIQALRLARAEDLAYAEDEVRTARARVDSLNRQNFVAVRNAQQQATVDFEAIAMTRAKQAAQDGYTAALAKQTIVQRANTAGAMAGSLASKGFGAVVSALGGPLGATAALLTTVAIVGPMAWEASKSSAQKASEEADKYLVRLREEVALLDRKNELQGQGRTGEAGLDDPTIKALQAKEKFYGEIQIALQAARERVRKSGGVDQNEVMGEQQLLAKLQLISKEYKEIATSAQRIRDDRNLKSSAATAASKADAETAAANAKREMAEQKKAQEQAKQVEDRKKAIKDLREEIETFGMAKEAVERYKMAKLGLANTKEFQELQAMKAIRRQDIADADLEIEKLEAKRRTAQVAFEENQQYLQAEADAFEAARETVNPLVREIEQLGYTGIWNGTFKQAWSDNPVWCFYDMATNRRYGAGRYLAAEGLDIWTLYQIAQYCDGLVSDGMGGQEPRYTFNAYFSKDEEAFKVLAHIISVARAQLYYGGSIDRPSTSLTAVQDVEAMPTALFSPSNIIRGRFNYSGTPRKTRYTEVTVWWNDPAQAFKLVPVLVVADPSYIARYGVQSYETVAFGATSKGQAIREGRRILLTNLLEQEIVSFSSGLEGIVAYPGGLAQIQDPGRDQKRQGGRLKEGCTTTVLVLDGQVTLQAGTAYTAWVTMPDGSVASRAISTPEGTVSSVTIAALPSAPQSEAQWQVTPTSTVPTRWRIIGVGEVRGDDSITYEITAIANDPAKYPLMDECGTITVVDPWIPDVFAPVTGLEVWGTTSWSDGKATPTISAKWVMPTGALDSSAWVRVNSGAWMEMVVSGASATLDLPGAGTCEVRVIAEYRYGASAATQATYEMYGVPTTTPATFVGTKTNTKPTDSNDPTVLRLSGEEGIAAIRAPEGDEDPDLDRPAYFVFSWTHTDAMPHALKGFRVVMFTGTDPNDASKYIKVVETNTSIHSTVIPIVATSPTTVNAAIQATYLDGNESSWRLLSGAIVVDPDTLRIPSKRTTDLINEKADTALTPSVVADGTTAQFLVRSNVKRTNLIKRCRDYAHASWTKFANGAATVPVVTANAGLAMDGTMTADRITFNRGGATSNDICTVSQNVTGQTVGSPYTPWIELKSNTGVDQQVMIYWGGLATGKGGGTITNVVTVTPEWKRFYCADLAASSTITIQFGTRVTFGDQLLDILVGHSQVETGTEPTPAILTLDSAVSDYGLTAEDWRGTFALSPVPRENIVRYSQDFTQAVWAKRNTATAAGNNLIAPDGSMTGDTISGLGAIYTNDLYQLAVGVTGTYYEPSFWIYKISTSGTLRLQNSNGGAGRWDINMALLPDGWSRIVRGHPAVTVTQEFLCAGNAIGPHLMAAAGAPLSFGCWEFKMEPGLVATPEITTLSTSVTRTDYTVANNLATLGVLPYQGTILRGLASNADGIISAASLDTKITNLERPGLRTIRAALAAKRTSAKAKAQAMVPVVSQAALDAAWTAFTANVDPILAATTDTTVVKVTFDGWWSAVETAVTDLQGAMARQAEATANSALAATIAAGSDGILSKGEKPGIVIDYTTATENHTMLLAKAQSCGVSYTDFSTAYGALRDYLTGLSPAYNDTTADTPINAASWAAVWNAWGSAYTSMLVRIASAAPSTVDAISTANHALTANASAPVVDGVTMTDGKVVMLAAQTTKTQNGVYRAVYTPPAASAYNVFPTSSAPLLPLAYDVVSGTTPNDATYAEISSGNNEDDFEEVFFSGFSGSNLTGDLTIKIAPTTGESAGMPHVNSSVQVQTSRDGGASYTTAAFYTDTLAMQTITVPVSGVTGSLLRVKVRAQSAASYGYDDNLNYVLLEVISSVARIHSVYLAIPASGSADWSFSREASIPNASVWRSRAGTSHGPGVHFLATVAADSGVTLTTQEAPYEAPMGKPATGSAFLKRDAAGINTWEARRYGFPDYASGASRTVGTVYQAATDGWISLVLSGDYMNDITLYVGSTNTPTDPIWRDGDNINVNTKYGAALVPIPAGTYYKVVSGSNPFESITYRWFPSL